MENNTPKPKINLSEKFPKMRPIGSTPSLFTLNGIGAKVYGRRDYDLETNTYVTTHCFCVLFIPIFAMGAYRVADAERGWYFLGKEPLSSFARNWNRCMGALCVVLALTIASSAYTSSPQYQAKQQLNQASKLLAAGQVIKAADIYKQVASGQVLVEDARQGLQKSLEQALQSNSPKELRSAFHILRALPGKLNKPAPLISGAFERGSKFVDQLKATDPEEALAIFDEVATLEPKNETLPSTRIDLLKLSIAKNPNNTNRVVELALVYESRRELKECRDLLLPLKDKLGSTEGARILGQMVLNDGNHEDAYALLFPYVQARLEQLHVVEKSYSKQANAASQRALNTLRDGHADPSFYPKYKAGSKAEKDAMVDEFITKEMQFDGAYQSALGELRAANKIVSVTLELGIVQLNRAQNIKDPTARKTELEAAEKTFLAIKGFAGETDEYRLFLGQVYYWLGKSSEGKQLFDQLLVSSKRSYKILMSLANTLRDVGERAQARELAEEAYRNGKDNTEKFAAAQFRAMALKDFEDEIAWLEKADVEQVHVQVMLDSARGNKALGDGDKIAAATYLRRAADGYGKVQKTSAALNNGGLVHLRLYEVTGDVKDYERGVAFIEEAVSMSPGDSILMMNAASMFVDRALMDIVGETINVKAVREKPSLQMVRCLYADEGGKLALSKRLHDNPTLKKALVYLDKAMLLSPKTTQLYELQLELQKGFREIDEIQKLRQRLHTAALDTTEAKKEWKESLTGAKDKEYRDKYETQIRKYETLLKSQEIQQDALAKEYVAITLCNLRQNAALYGTKVNAQEMLNDSLSYHEKHPDAATAATVENAYLYLAHTELMESEPSYAAIYKQSWRAIAPQSLIPLLVENGGSISDVIRQNANVQKAVQLKREYRSKFPSYPHPADWALFKTMDRVIATGIADTFAKNEVTGLLSEVEWELEPLVPSTVLDHFWTLKMRGDEQKAKEVYDVARREGVPLPKL
ncbi:MAG: hypothetical protein JWM68_404 [Verrucomicrobiales bacterium]|nr:hypothetical protein [Verrucomicrobiales bacterium]